MSNPNRQLSAEEVETRFGQQLPHLVEGLGSDRAWIWYSGPKPSEAERTIIKELGFGFTPKPHTLEDGRAAHWFHACGGAVLRRGRKGPRVSSRQESTGGRVSSPQQPDSLDAELARMAALL